MVNAPDLPCRRRHSARLSTLGARIGDGSTATAMVAESAVLIRRPPSCVPGMAEDPHPVAAEDLGYLRGSIAAALHLCTQMVEAGDAAEAVDICDLRLFVAELGGILVILRRVATAGSRADEVRAECDMIDTDELLEIVELVDIAGNRCGSRERPGLGVLSRKNARGLAGTCTNH